MTPSLLSSMVDIPDWTQETQVQDHWHTFARHLPRIAREVTSVILVLMCVTGVLRTIALASTYHYCYYLLVAYLLQMFSSVCSSSSKLTFKGKNNNFSATSNNIVQVLSILLNPKLWQ